LVSATKRGLKMAIKIGRKWQKKEERGIGTIKVKKKPDRLLRDDFGGK
jgi:hypothetical protein